MFSKFVLKQFQARSTQLALNLRIYSRNFRTNITSNLRNSNSHNTSFLSGKYILGMSGALTLSTLHTIPLNGPLEDTENSTNSEQQKWMSEPEEISKALQHGAAFTYGDYGDEVIVGSLSNNIQFLRNIKNLIITGNTSLNEAAYAKQLMEYLELKSFDSIEIIDACDMNNIYNNNIQTGVLTVGDSTDNNMNSNVVSIVNENTFTSNVAVLSLISAWFSQLDSNNENNNRQELIVALHKLHTYVGGVIRRTKDKCIQIADFINSKSQPQNIYILGAGFGECIAKEGVSKIKEIHSNNVNAKTDYNMDEIDEDCAVIMLILDDENSQIMVKNAREIERKTNGKMIYITDNIKLLKKLTQKDIVIEIPSNGPLTALLAIVPIQIIAYYVGINHINK